MRRGIFLGLTALLAVLTLAARKGATPPKEGKGAAVVPTPAPGYGVLYGRLIRAIPNQPEQPIAGGKVYLAPLVHSTEGEPWLIGLDPERDVYALTDEEGRFVFERAEPGTYGLVYWTPVGSTPLTRGEEQVIVTIEAGSVIDVGEIRIDFPF